MVSGRTFRIGTGAAFPADRLDAAADLAARGELDLLVFAGAEPRALTSALREALANPAAGFTPLLAARLHALLPFCAQSGTRIVTNLGLANPAAAAERAAAVAGQLGFRTLTIACLEGDDVTSQIAPETELDDGSTVGTTGRRLLGARAWLGADALLPALETGAQIVIAGAVGGSSLFLGPLRERFGWADDDWRALAGGTLAGHLLSQGTRLTGVAGPAGETDEAADMARLGAPLAELQADGTAVITKLPDTGGRITADAIQARLQDLPPRASPDVALDLQAVEIATDGSDRVRISGAEGRPRPDHVEVALAFDGGILAEAEIAYAGRGAADSARLARDVLHARMTRVQGVIDDLQIELFAVSPLDAVAIAPERVRLRASLHATSPEAAGTLFWEVESLLGCHPPGGRDYRSRITPSVITRTTTLPRDQVTPAARVLVT